MGSDCMFVKTRETRRRRTQETKEERASTWLILCEGKETEVNYFTGLIDEINKRGASKIKAEIVGVGRNPSGLVKFVEDCTVIRDKMLGQISIPFYKVALVFDKDEFTDNDFNNAALSQDIDIVAWSNESFELWLLLHFQYQCAALHRDQYCEKITEEFQKQGICTKKQQYKKNDKDIYMKVTSFHGSLKQALRNSKKILEDCNLRNPASINPGTTVGDLVLALAEEANFQLE